MRRTRSCGWKDRVPQVKLPAQGAGLSFGLDDAKSEPAAPAAAADSGGLGFTLDAAAATEETAEETDEQTAAAEETPAEPIAAEAPLAAEGEKARKIDYQDYPAAPEQQTQQNADQKSMGCVSCHTASDAATMHSSPAVVLGCTDCHGGSADVSIPFGPYTDEVYAAARDSAHVLPLYPESWHYPSSANPERSYTLLNSESTEFVRFVNPADYRAATEACGACHQHIIDASVATRRLANARRR